MTLSFFQNGMLIGEELPIFEKPGRILSSARHSLYPLEVFPFFKMPSCFV